MFNATVLMISRDRSLNRSVSRGINALQGFELRIVEGLDQIGTSIKEKGLDLVMVHLDGSMGYAQVARVLWMSSILPRPVPVLAVTERYRIQEALAMFRMGVADYVSRADHLDKLGALIEVLTLQVRMSAPRTVETVACPAVQRRPRFTHASQ